MRIHEWPADSAPPSATTSYAAVPEAIRKDYTIQARLLYSEMQLTLGQDRMVSATAQENVGLHLNTPVSGEADAGPSALSCIVSTYGK